MTNETYQYTLTQEEATIIEDIRAMTAKKDSSPTVHNPDNQRRQELIEKYLDMSVAEFMDQYGDCFGDYVITNFVLESLSQREKIQLLWDHTDESFIDQLLEDNLSDEVLRMEFFSFHDHQELVDKLVNEIIAGNWEPEN